MLHFVQHDKVASFCMFYCFFCHSEQREESPTKAFTKSGDTLSKQLENQTKCEAEKPKLKFQIPNFKPQKMAL